MKVRLTKKMLCAVLSMLMVITSLPLVVFADEAEDAQAALLNSAIENYEIKMDGTIYNNMPAAYKAYCEAVKVYDKYMYTNAKFQKSVLSSELEEKTKTLTTATDEMTPWEPNITEVQPDQENNNDRPKLTYEAYYNNILYAKPIPNGTGASTTIGGTTVNTYLGDTIVYYNGEEDTAVVPVGIHTNGGTLYSAYPSQGNGMRKDSNDISLGYIKGTADGPDTELGDNNYWTGTYANNGDFQWSFGHFKSNPGDRNYVAADYTTGLKIIVDSGRFHQENGESVFNGIKVKALSNDQYSKTITPTWYIVADNTSSEGYITDTSKIYVLNYNALTLAIERNSQKLSIGIANTYAAGGLENVINAFDAAIKVNINSYDYSANMENAFNDASQAIQTAVEGLDNAKSKADPSEYQSLRDAIDSQRARYEENKADDFAEMKELYENTEQFQTKYEAALSAMTTALTSEPVYSDNEETLKNVASVAEELNTFLLEGKKPRVDTVLLENTIDNAQYIVDNSSFFDKTASDETQVQKIKEAIKAAKVAIWQDEANYPLDRFEPEDTDDNFFAVLEQVANIRNTIAGFKINPDAEVSYVTKGEDPQSLNEVRTAAKDIIDNHSAEYSNIVILSATYEYTTEYLENAEKSTLSETSTTRQNYVRDFVTSYKDLVVNLYDAMNSLTPSFTASLPNGTIIDAGTPKSINISHSIQKKNCSVQFNYSSEQIIFRTTNEASDVTLGHPTLIINNTVDNSNTDYKRGNYLDALNFDTNDSWGNSEQSPGNNKVPDMDENTKSHNGNLTTAANDGASYKVKNIIVTDKGNGERYGSHIGDSNTNAIDDPNYIYDNYIATNEGDKNGAGINAWNGSTYARTDYVLSLPAVEDTECTSKDYTFDTNLGMLMRYKANSGAIINPQRAGWVWNYASYTQKTTVINIAPLINKINAANELVVGSNNYTSESLNNLVTAIDEADNEFSYWELGASAITKLINDRINAIDKAISELDSRADFTKKIDFTFGDGDEQKDYSYNYTEAKDLVFRILNGAPLESDPNYKTNYAQTYTMESLEKLAAYLTGTIDDKEANSANHSNWNGKPRFEYLNCDSEVDRYKVPASEQDKINWEITQLVNAATVYDANSNPKGLLEVVDRSAYSAAVFMSQNLNADAYDVDAVKKAVDDNPLPNRSVSVNGNQIVCNTQDDIDQVTEKITTAVTDAWYKYSVTIVDTDGNKYYLKNEAGDLTEKEGVAEKADFHYGDIVKVKSFDGEKAAFSTTVIANGTGKQSDKRLITTATEYEFDVRGNTTVYVTSASSDTHVKVTFIDSRDDRAIAFAYAPKDMVYNMNEAPVPRFMYYNIKDFTVKDGENDGAGTTVANSGSYTFKNDTEVVVNYELSGTHESSGKYNVTVLGTDGNQISQNSYDYNVRVRVTVDDAAAFVDNDTYSSDSPEVIAYGNSYAFYTCQSITLRAVDETYLSQHNLNNNNNYSVSVIKAPIVDGNSVQIVGTFASLDNAKPKQYGIILDASGNTEGNLDLSMVKNSSKIYNFSCSKIIGENQFASSVTFGTAPEKFRYVAYAIYHIREDITGTERDVIVYSPVKTYTKGA